jgi:hypothetical protein
LAYQIGGSRYQSHQMLSDDYLFFFYEYSKSKMFLSWKRVKRNSYLENILSSVTLHLCQDCGPIAYVLGWIGTLFSAFVEIKITTSLEKNSGACLLFESEEHIIHTHEST